MIRAFTILAVLAVAGPTLAAPPPPTPADIATFRENGQYVFRTDQTNMPLYTFDKDEPGKSNCVGGCATAWPPVLATEARPAGDWTPFKRADGATQWAWRGKPVYSYAADKPEKATGDGVGGVWRLLPTLPAN